MEEYLIKETTFEKIRKEIAKNQEKKIIFSAFDEEISRKVLEKLKINIFLISQKNRKDKLYQRDSGFNEVLSKLAKSKEVEIGINLDEIILAKKEEKSQILSRIRQNIFLCKKAKIKMRFINLSKECKRDKYDLKALGLILGMPTWMI